jgi:hypothetical protein
LISKWQRLLAILAALATVLLQDAGQAAEHSMISVAYVSPKEPSHTAIYESLREKRALELIADHLASLKLPRRLTLKAEGCHGDVNAWYDSDTAVVTICYEYLAYIQDLARDLSPTAVAEGLTPQNYVAGPFLEVVLHELAHAVFDLKKVPVLGREEDAADQVAAYMLLQLGEREARRTIISIAAMYASEAKEAPPKLKDFANEHGVPAQRLYNLLCLSYGKDPKMFGDLVEKGYLPHERAELCKDEYRQVRFAFTRLVDRAPKSMRKLARVKPH